MDISSRGPVTPYTPASMPVGTQSGPASTSSSPPATEALGNPATMSPAEMLTELGNAVAGAQSARTPDGEMDAGAVLAAAQGMVDFGVKATGQLDTMLAERSDGIEALRASGAPQDQIDKAEDGQKVLQALRDVIAKHTERLAEILRSRGSDDELEKKLADMKRSSREEDELAAAEHAAQVADLTSARPTSVQPSAELVATAYAS